VPAKLHKHVYTILVVSFNKLSHLLFRIVETLKHKTILTIINKLYCNNNSRESSQVAVYTICVLIYIYIYIYI
jgi:hypothetical protein